MDLFPSLHFHKYILFILRSKKTYYYIRLKISKESKRKLIESKVGNIKVESIKIDKIKFMFKRACKKSISSL